VLDHRSAGDVSQGLARETGRLVPRGDDRDGRDGNPKRGRPGVRNRGHGRYYHVVPRLGAEASAKAAERSLSEAVIK
jgi:hypothetical protein